MSATRKNYPPEKKVEILREHLKNKVSVSEVCEKYSIKPNLFYRWEKQLFEGGINTFSQIHSKNGTAKDSLQLKKMKETVHNKDEVISWLTEENIKLKKTFGDL
ncbi:MAG TPA: transposase [bacterium]|nr:transposase [bacterium]